MNNNPFVDPAPPAFRRLAWIGIGLGCVSLICVAIAAFLGGAIPWWAWAIPGLGIFNTCVLVLRAFRNHPQLEKWFPWLGVAFTLVILVSQIRWFFLR